MSTLLIQSELKVIHFNCCVQLPNNFQRFFSLFEFVVLFRIGLKLPLPLQTTAQDDTVTYEILVKL